MVFEGFGPGTISFLQDLSANNDRTWFDENRERYEAEVRGPAEAFILTLGGLLSSAYPSVRYDIRRNGAGSLMRIYRDVRFSRDKRPLKENVGIIFPLMEGKKVEVPIFYFHIEPAQFFFYGGWHVFPPEILERYRLAVDDGERGNTLSSIMEALASRGLKPMEDPAYKRVPRPYDAEHPRADLLRQAALGVGIEFSPEELERPDLAERCLAAASDMRPLMDWLMALA